MYIYNYTYCMGRKDRITMQLVTFVYRCDDTNWRYQTKLKTVIYSDLLFSF